MIDKSRHGRIRGGIFISNRAGLVGNPRFPQST
jgi:hypothetical protein